MNVEEMLTRIDMALKSSDATQGLTATFGLPSSLLPPKKRDRFVVLMEQDTVIMKDARRLVMDSTEEQIPRIGFHGRILTAPKVEGQPLDPDTDAVRPDDGIHSLKSTKAMGLVTLTDEEIQTNIMRANFETLLLDMIASRLGVDLEQWGIQGDADTPSPVALFALNNGWIKQAGLRIVDNSYEAATGGFTITATGLKYYDFYVGKAGVPITPGTFVLNTDAPQQVAHDDNGLIVEDNSSGLYGDINYYTGKIRIQHATQVAPDIYDYAYTVESFDTEGTDFPMSMFDKAIWCLQATPYFRNRKDWKFYVPWHVFDAYQTYVSERETVLGDQALTADGSIPYKGCRITYVPEMPDDKCLITLPNNTTYGIFKDIKIERGRRHLAQSTDFVIDIQPDFDYENRQLAIEAQL